METRSNTADVLDLSQPSCASDSAQVSIQSSVPFGEILSSSSNLAVDKMETDTEEPDAAVLFADGGDAPDVVKKTERGINDLPDELLENVFARLSPYDDLDAVRVVCHRWNKVAKSVIRLIKANFHQAIRHGTLRCEMQSAVYNENGRIVGSWISQRFGQMCCSFDKKFYIMGGTTHTPTTFNDMWNFDLSTRIWTRVVPKGSYPSPKALGTFVKYKGNMVMFGGWAHPCPYPFMQPWRIFDELHIYNVEENRWNVQETSNGPPPTAGRAATVHGDSMVVFGGRTFDQELQSYPLSKTTWIYDFTINEWHKLRITDETKCPSPRYGHTQVAIDDSHLLVIGGCGGPNQIFSDVWLLTIGECTAGSPRHFGHWLEMKSRNEEKSISFDFHYAGCMIDDTVIFFERSSRISPFLSFLHFGAQGQAQGPTPPAQAFRHGNGIVFEPDRGGFNARCSSGLRSPVPSGTMPIYTLDISQVLVDGTVRWDKEPVNQTKYPRPNERLLYSMVAGRGEIILFGGFYKEPNGRRCRVSNDLYFLGTSHKTY